MDDELATIADQSQELLQTFAPNVWIEATIIVIVALLVAKLADLIIVGFLSRLLARTENTLDDSTPPKVVIRVWAWSPAIFHGGNLEDCISQASNHLK